MEDLNKLDKKIRNISLVMIMVAFLFWFVWLFLYLADNKQDFQYFLYIGLILLLAGLLIFTRIQFAIWAEKKAFEDNN